MAQHYLKRRLENLEKNGPNLTLIDLITFDQNYIDWYIRVHKMTPLMKAILED
jgi:hypothetical protein